MLSTEKSIISLLEALSPEELTILVDSLGLMLTKDLVPTQKVAFANLLLTTGGSILCAATIELAILAQEDEKNKQASANEQKKMAKQIEELQKQVKKLLETY